jgi:hypothetical protein
MDRTSIIVGLLLTVLSCGPIRAATANGPAFDVAKIEQITGLKGTWNADERVFKIAQPRTDVSITVDGAKLSPFMGLTSWVGFQDGRSSDCMIMGDLVLFQDEVNPVMSVLLDHGLAVTALHNHFFYDEPRTFFMHLGGEGTAEAVATGVREAFAEVHRIRTETPTPTGPFAGPARLATNSISSGPLDEILGTKGLVLEGQYKAVFGRVVKMACGCEIGKEMGVNTWAAFCGSDQNAVVDGDFAVLEGELQPVLKALRHAGINIVAIHHHMTAESPRMLFLHYWGKGKAADLAQAVRSALTLTSTPLKVAAAR